MAVLLPSQTAFFRQHNLTMDSKQKYHSRAAAMYKEKLANQSAQSLRMYGTQVRRLRLLPSVFTVVFFLPSFSRTVPFLLRSSTCNHQFFITWYWLSLRNQVLDQRMGRDPHGSKLERGRDPEPLKTTKMKRTGLFL